MSLKDKVWVCALVALCWSGSAPAQQATKPTDLADKSIEDLMNIEVTSVSKMEEKLSRTASAIFVINQDDIQRSGATDIPDLLRMVPGLDVAQIDASTWAITARGFNQQSSDKLLVLIDGRTVYSPLFSGVDWDAQAVPLENIDRIEVIRGPGASVWGANAVNGVINIISKKADQTQGGLVVAGGGTNEPGFGTVRFGGRLGAAGAYRITSNYSNHDHMPDLLGQNGDDQWDVFRTSFRADKQLTTKDSLTLGITGYSGSEGERVPEVTSISPPLNQVLDLREQFSGWSVMPQWNHAFSSRSNTSLKVYFDRTDRHDPTAGEGLDIVDIDFQNHLEWGDRQSLVWGLGYREESDATNTTWRVSFSPANHADQIFSPFVQDEFAIVPQKLSFTVGAKLEHNSLTGFAFQPNVRIAWIVSDHAMVWSSFSIAARTPSFADVGVRFTEAAIPGPGGLTILETAFGNPLEGNEDLHATEFGYRKEIGEQISFDLTTFFNDYKNLRSTEPGTPYFETNPSPPHLVASAVFNNLLYGETHGAEAALSWKVSNRWTLSPGYAFLAIHLHPDSTSQDFLTGPSTEGSSPAHQAQLRSHVVLPNHLQFDVSTYFVGPLPAQSVPSYTRLDAGLTWQAYEGFSIVIVGQNLLQDHHLETSNVDQIVQSSLIKRQGYAKVTWHF